MKKIFFAVLALAGLAACSTDEVVSRPQGAAIGFDSFVDHTTRAAEDLTFENLENFGVYGSVVNSSNQQGMIFTNQEVTGSKDNGYSYSPVQYWIADASYDFVAFAPYDGAKWEYDPNPADNNEYADDVDAYNGVLSFDNAAAKGEQDLLFASAERTTGTLDATPEKVGFTFGHLLSKVAFKFTNMFTDGNITLNVYGVKITNAAANGTIAVADGATGTWTATGDYLRTFGLAAADASNLLANGGGNITTEHFYFIPAQRNYNIQFKVDVTQAGVLLQTYEHSVTANISIEKGKSYSINAVLTPENVNPNPNEQLYPIEFQVVKVEDWTNADVALEAVTVADAASLEAAVANGGDIRLTGDITLSGDELNVAEGKNVNLDLNGKTLTVNALDPIENKGKMTIANGKVVANYGENTRRCIYNYGEMTINGVEFVQTYDKKGAAINNEGKMVINDATVDAVYYSIWNSGADAELTINGGNYTTTNNVDVRDEWAYAVVCRNGAKMTINGGSFVGNHGVIAAEGGEVVLNGGTYHCTATYTGNSDWTLYAADGGSIRYNAAACTVTSANPSGATYGNVTTL